MFASKKVCASCGHYGKPKQAAKGSTGVELILWLLFIIPGLIYSFWRMGSYHPVCAKCKGTQLVPAKSPIGQKMLKEFHPTLSK